MVNIYIHVHVLKLWGKCYTKTVLPLETSQIQGTNFKMKRIPSHTEKCIETYILSHPLSNIHDTGTFQGQLQKTIQI